MNRSEHSIVEWLRGPVIAVDEQTQVGEMLQLSRDTGAHYFAIQRRSKTVGRACACDLQTAAPNSAVALCVRPVHMTLSPETSVDAALAVLNAGMDWTIVEHNGGLLGVVTWHDLQETLDGFDKAHGYYCNGCGADHCLKKYRHHMLLCPVCLDRALQGDWYDMGAAG